MENIDVNFFSNKGKELIKNIKENISQEEFEHIFLNISLQELRQTLYNNFKDNVILNDVIEKLEEIRNNNSEFFSECYLKFYISVWEELLIIIYNS